MQTVVKNKKKVDLKGQNQFNTPHTQIAQSEERMLKAFRFLVESEFASRAQSVEQRIENPRVRGSIPRRGTIY